MQYITNIGFWLQAAMGSVAGAVGVAAVLLILCLFVVGIGIGRIWNAKWKMGLAGFVISLLIALITATLGAVYMGMGFIKDTVLATGVKTTVVEDCCRSLSDNPRLMKSAFQEGLKNMISSGVETESLDPEAEEFQLPAEMSDEAKRTNKEQFLKGVAKVIALGEPAKKGSKTAAPGMNSIKPFAYGFEPVYRDKDGMLFAAFEESLQGRDDQAISVEDPFWYNGIVRFMSENSLKSLNNTVCKDLDSQRAGLLTLIIILILLQGGLISWLALTDIRPQTRRLPAVK